jgi:hypothetical protein
MFARLCLLSVLSMGAFVTPAVSKDNTGPANGQVGGWQIRVDPRLGNGCFASQHYADGTGLRLGIVPDRLSLYLILGNPAWKSLEDGKTYSLRFVFDQAKTYDTDMLAGVWGDMIVLIGSGLSADFVADFMEGTNLRVDYHGGPLAHLSLRNADAALAELAKCQQEMQAAGGGNRNAAVRPASDPISR